MDNIIGGEGGKRYRESLKGVGIRLSREGGNGHKESKLDVMRVLREIFYPELEWLDSKGAPLDPTLGGREKELWFNGEWTERYGIIAGGLYFEEEVGLLGAYRPIRGVLVGIRGQGRKKRRGRPKKYSKPLEIKKLGYVSPARKIIRLDKKLQKMYRLEEDIKRGIKEVSIEEKEDLKRRLELLERLVRSITLGKRVGVCRFRSTESEYGTIGAKSTERFLVEKIVKTDFKSVSNNLINNTPIVVKYVVKWEHLGKIKSHIGKNGKSICRFIKSID